MHGVNAYFLSAGALYMFSFSTEEMADLVKRIFTRSAPVSRTKVSSDVYKRQG